MALSTQLARCQYQLVTAAAAVAESPEWILDGSPTPTHWLAAVADVEECAYPSTTAQYADAVEELLDQGAGTVDAEVVFHVRGDGATCDDGTPVCDTVIAQRTLVDELQLRCAPCHHKRHRS